MGSSIGFTLNGGKTHKTWLGTFLTLITLTVVLAYTMKRYEVMYNKADTTFLRTISPDVFDKKDPFTFRDTQFNIAFGL